MRSPDLKLASPVVTDTELDEPSTDFPDATNTAPLDIEVLDEVCRKTDPVLPCALEPPDSTRDPPSPLTEEPPSTTTAPP
jgi:hypothetical protein